jgi:hypothetical protein
MRRSNSRPGRASRVCHWCPFLTVIRPHVGLFRARVGLRITSGLHRFLPGLRPWWSFCLGLETKPGAHWPGTDDDPGLGSGGWLPESPICREESRRKRAAGGRAQPLELTPADADEAQNRRASAVSRHAPASGGQRPTRLTYLIRRLFRHACATACARIWHVALLGTGGRSREEHWDAVAQGHAEGLARTGHP